MSRIRVPNDGIALGRTLEFLRSLWQTSHAIERVSSYMTRTLGITAQQRMIIRILGRHPGITGGRLARELHLDPGTVSTTLGNLERSGLVIRQRVKADRRSSTIELTDAGRALDHPKSGTIEHAVDMLLLRTPRRRLRACLGTLADLVALLDAEVSTMSRTCGSARPADRRRKKVGKAR